MSILLKGAPVATSISEDLKVRCSLLKENGVTPGIAIVRVGERPDDLSYERAALKRLEGIGIAVRQYILAQDCSEDELLGVIDEINTDKTVHGCLMFRPLPDREAEKKAAARLLPEKDLDCMTAGSLAGVFAGSGAGFPPCTAQAVIELCDFYGIELEGKEVAVIGRSLVIGKPVSMLLQGRNATVTMCHTRTRDLAEVCRRADIIVAAAGHAGLVTAECVSGRSHFPEEEEVAYEAESGRALNEGGGMSEDGLEIRKKEASPEAENSGISEESENIERKKQEKPAWLNLASGQTVIDVGINVGADGKLTGDVDFENVEPKVAAITPVPGGVGSITTAVLAKHVIEAAERAANS